MGTLRSYFLGDRSRIKKLEESHADLKEDKMILHNRTMTHQESLDSSVKVEVGEMLRQRRQPGKEWTTAEITGKRGSDEM
jgi:hypothetical protein